MENSVWETVLAILASFGGAGIIILGASKWLANLTAEKILKKTEFEFSQKLEALKSDLEKRNYISRVRFDLEIEIYRELSEKFMHMMFSVSKLFPNPFETDSNRNKTDEELSRAYSEANESFLAARKFLLRNAAFIPEQIFVMCEKLFEPSQVQLLDFRLLYLDKLWKDKQADFLKTETDAFYRTEKVASSFNTFFNTLRRHLK